MRAPLARTAVAVVVLASALVGCGQQAAAPQPSPRPGVCAPQALSPDGGCVSQGFRLSGELSGTVADAYVEARCPAPLLGERLNTTTMDFRLAGHAYRLVLDPGATTFLEKAVMLSQSGTGMLARLSVSDTGAATLGAWESTDGSMTVDASGTGGSLGLRLLAQNTSGGRPLRLDGRWRCAQKVKTSSPTPSECSTVLTAPHPEGADLAALAAGGCHRVSMDLTGALSGHAEQAIVVSPGADLQDGCNKTAQALHARFDIAPAGRVLTVTVWLRRDPIRGELTAGTYPDPGYVQAIDPPPVTVSAGQLGWTYKSGAVTLAPDLAGGTLDVDLQGGSADFGETVHLSGAWWCG